ncbi:MAG: gas vesicle protein [Streptosporangiales bacterium]|nr:gas vesicle protein [Streptosporangiales bacterium]
MSVPVSQLDTDATVVQTGAGYSEQRVALVDLLDRLLAGGVVLAGDITISIADVDLVRISLRALITSIRPDDAPSQESGRR